MTADAQPSPIAELRRTTFVCPAQWEGRTEDDRPVYIRCRNALLSVRFGPVGGDASSAVLALPWWEQDLSDDVTDFAEVASLTKLRTSAAFSLTDRYSS